jgi:phosphoglycerate dehydrogenase-like enzyme
MKITILYDYFFETLSTRLLAEISDAAPGYTVSAVSQSIVELKDLIDSEIVFGRVPPHLLEDLPNLKWLHLASAGADGMTDISLYANKSIMLTKSSGTFGIPMAEHIIGMMIALSRNSIYYYEEQKRSRWCGTLPDFVDVYGSTVLVLGLGDIGTEVCKRLLAFGCKLIGFRRDASKPHELLSDVRPISKLHDCLPEADYVIICTPGTVETKGLFGREEFALMKDKTIIINVGRGIIIDSDALNEALVDGKIGGAGLDVTDPEPLPEEHPLWNAPNLLITPHISAATKLTTERRAGVFINLLKLYVAGQEMYNIVDFDAGY